MVDRTRGLRTAFDKNHRQALSRLDNDEKNGVIVTDAMGRPQLTTLVKEWGLYHLIEDSRKPEAEKFRRWLHREVLPSIRKTGSYSVGPGLIDPANMSKFQILEMALESEKSCIKEKKARMIPDPRPPRITLYRLGWNKKPIFSWNSGRIMILGLLAFQ